MSFGGFNLGGSSELPFATPSNVGMRSRTNSVSSVHSNHSTSSHHQQQQQQQQYSPYGSRPGTPSGGANGDGYIGSGYGAGGYDGYGSGFSSPVSLSSAHTPTPPTPSQQRPHGYYGQQAVTSGYDSPTGVSSSSFYGHSRSHSNASETSLNIDTGLEDDAPYSPGPSSLSSASSSRRGSVSDSGSGFFKRKVSKTFRPGPRQSPDDYPMDSLDSDEGDNRCNLNSRKLRTRKHHDDRSGSGNTRGRKGMKDIFNDWDLLLPSADAFVGGDDDDDDGLNDDEKRKKRQLAKKGWESSRGQGILLAILVIIAVLVRIWKLAVPSAVVFDEQHFGGFAADYLKGEFFLDIHPPLGKMLFALVAYMLGFDGDFEFTPGKLYNKNVPYIGMRMFAVACGVGLIPISYLTIRRSGHSTQAAMICAILITFENAMITQSRFILLDAPMMLFMGYTMLSWIDFYNYRNRPFTRGWWFSLLKTGFCLFLSSSVKWVGLFTVATVGVCVLKYLQEARTHLYISTRDFSKQFVALFICLLVFPAVLYLGLHVVDFRLLPKSGSGNAWVSPQFQMTLKGHDVLPVMADIAWDSKVHIRHANTNGGWVHSMPGEYTREGSKDQAIQLVEWDDDLTCWQIYPADLKLRQKHIRQKQERKQNPAIAFDGYVYDGDEIRLRHCYSKIALATNDIESLGSNKTFLREVRGIKWLKQPTGESIWRVELVQEGLVPGLADDHGVQQPQPQQQQQQKQQQQQEGKESAVPAKVLEQEMKDGPVRGQQDAKETRPPRDQNKQWHSIKGFRLWNEKQQCYLQSHKVFRAPYSTYQEVTCVQGPRQKANTIFIIDQNVNPHLPASTPSLSYQPLSFFQKFLELNRVMWWTHHDLSAPINGDSHSNSQATDASRPWTWPFMKRGMNYYSSKETNHYVHFMGNPLLWWAAAAAVALYMSSCLWSVIKYLKGKQETKIERDRFGITPFYAVASGTFYAGWAIHYIPFFFMSRQVFLHHYLPSLYFSILLFVSRLDRTWQRWPARIRYLTGLALMAVVILSWYNFAPFAYGTDFGSSTRCEQLGRIGGWKFICQREELPWARRDNAAATAATRMAEEQGYRDEDTEEETQFYGDESAENQRLQQDVERVVDGFVQRKEPEVQQQQQQQGQPQKQQQQSEDSQSNVEVEERRKKMMLDAESRAKEVLEKQQLMADKLALETKQKELEERLAAQERELERQRQIHEQLELNKAERERQSKEQQQQQQQQQEQQRQQQNEHQQRLNENQRQKDGQNAAMQKQDELIRQMLEEQVRLLQAQLENNNFMQHRLHEQQQQQQ
ncbi:hypothetical protein BGZ50_009183 [Haplosporangium sp. Z 11]|nr:hypothetical protein BGZ50_009183 [Haplosporangium sp. Z 11]